MSDVLVGLKLFASGFGMLEGGDAIDHQNFVRICQAIITTISIFIAINVISWIGIFTVVTCALIRDYSQQRQKRNHRAEREN